jgi:hypothetical protein
MQTNGWIVTMDETFRHTTKNMVLKQKGIAMKLDYPSMWI